LGVGVGASFHNVDAGIGIGLAIGLAASIAAKG
jgi:hypothetical protein